MDFDFCRAFEGVKRVYGTTAFQKISKARCLVIGVGGVGGWVAEGLVRSGVASITIVDGDDVCLSNTNRQIQGFQHSVGQMKVEALGDRLLDINPLLHLEMVCDFLNPESSEMIFNNPYDVVVDCIDQTRNKVEAAVTCGLKKIPLVTMGAAGGLIDPSKIRTGDLRQAEEDSLLSSLRKTLRVRHGYPRGKEKMGILSVYSVEKRRYPVQSKDLSLKGSSLIDVTENKPTDLEGSLDCTGRLGSSMAVTTTFAMFGVSQALSILGRRTE